MVLVACTTVTYPNGTSVTVPWVPQVNEVAYPAYYGSPYGTCGVYGGGYYPVYGCGYGYQGCWNRPYWNNCNGGWNGWNRWNGGNCWNGGGYRAGCGAPAAGNYATAGWRYR